LTSAEAFANPLGIGLGLKLIGVIARVLLRTGVIDALEDRVAATDTPLDDFAVKIVSHILQEAAKL